MRRLALAACALPVLVSALGCLATPDEDGVIALDYRIDRPRVLGIQVHPLAPMHGRPITVDALVMAPGPIDRVEADLCGLREDVRVEVGGSAECFTNPDLVQPLADRLPFRWEPPDLSGIDCEPIVPDTGPFVTDRCASDVPLRVAVHSEGDVGYGQIEVPIRLYATPEVEIETLAAAERHLEVVGAPRRGEEIGFVYRIRTDAPDLSFRWYVDAGELRRTGRTVTQQEVDGVQITVNRLTLPTTWVGPLRVAVVAVRRRPGADLVDDVAWDVVTVDVPR